MDGAHLSKQKAARQGKTHKDPPQQPDGALRTRPKAARQGKTYEDNPQQLHDYYMGPTMVQPRPGTSVTGIRQDAASSDSDSEPDLASARALKPGSARAQAPEPESESESSESEPDSASARALKQGSARALKPGSARALKPGSARAQAPEPDQESDPEPDSDPELDPESEPESEPEPEPEPEPAFDPYIYRMSAKPRGFTVIININKVKDCKDRKGSEKDVKRLRELFGGLHFKVKSYKDLEATAIKDTLTYISKSPKLGSHDCLIVVLMSHGGEGFILGADREKVKLEDVIDLFSNDKCSGLIGKPKLFFIQACSGGNKDKGVICYDQIPPENLFRPIDLPPTLPSMSDILLAKASVKGDVSWRNGIGSYFIQSLVDVIQKHKEDLDIGRMMTRVVNAVSRMTASTDSGDYKQCPTHNSTLTKDLYFNP